MILKQGHTYEPMPHDGKVIRRIYRGGRCYYIASPYSKAATQALKAAFPQYFAAICDYGYAHPQLVPFVNEDPMLIVSLVEVGKTRWLVGDGKSYIYTDVELSNNLGFIIKSQSTNVNATNTFVYGSGGGGRLGLSYYNSETSYVLHYNSTYHVKSNFPNQMEIHTFSHNVEKGKFYVDGQLYDSWTWTSTPSGKMGLFAVSLNSESARARVAFVEFVDNQTNDQVAHFIPMQRTDGTCGMLDIVSLTFYPNANTQGSFTIEITDKE